MQCIVTFLNNIFIPTPLFVCIKTAISVLYVSISTNEGPAWDQNAQNSASFFFTSVVSLITFNQYQLPTAHWSNILPVQYSVHCTAGAMWTQSLVTNLNSCSSARPLAMLQLKHIAEDTVIEFSCRYLRRSPLSWYSVTSQYSRPEGLCFRSAAMKCSKCLCWSEGIWI